MDNFTTLLETLGQFETVKVVEYAQEPDTWINFHCICPNSLSAISDQVAEAHEISGCAFRIISEDNRIIYRIIMSGTEELKNRTIILLIKMLQNALVGDARVAENIECGLPDLSAVTIRQMAQELKARTNLCFALVWIEGCERDNIAIEGSGNPTQLVGLLARGQNIAVDWANKKMTFHRPQN